MPEIVERGYLYIAQPPLFRVGKGKKGTYLKNTEEMNNFLLEKASEKVSVKVNGKSFTGVRLQGIMHQLIRYNHYLELLARRGYGREIIDELLKKKVRFKNQFDDSEKAEKLRTHFQMQEFTVGDLMENEENGTYEFDVCVGKNGGMIRRRIGSDLINQVEYKEIFALNQNMAEFDKPPFTIAENGSIDEVDDKVELLNRVLKIGRGNLNIQRYKGLGEMNPEQLWETTMDPEKRMLLQVRVDDIVEADSIFTILMGDEVEPRRQFIQDNALAVTNLDV
jgi:DNA gyrase subunit B